MKITDHEAIRLSLGKDSFIFYTGSISEEMGRKLLFFNDRPCGERETPEEFDDKTNPRFIYIPYRNKKGNFGKYGKYPTILMEDNDDPIISENFNDWHFMYMDTHLIKILDEQIKNNMVYRGFTNDFRCIIRKEHYREVLEKVTEFILKIISNYKKYTVSRLKENSNYIDICCIFEVAIKDIIGAFTDVFMYNKSISFRYYKKINDAINIMTKSLLNKITRLRKLQFKSLDCMEAKQSEYKRYNKIMDRLHIYYYMFYFTMLSKKEQLESIKYMDFSDFVKYAIPIMKLSGDELTELANTTLKEHLEGRLADFIYHGFIFPKQLQGAELNLEFKSLDSALILRLIEDEKRSDYECNDSCSAGC